MRRWILTGAGLMILLLVGWAVVALILSGQSAVKEQYRVLSQKESIIRFVDSQREMLGRSADAALYDGDSEMIYTAEMEEFGILYATAYTPDSEWEADWPQSGVPYVEYICSGEMEQDDAMYTIGFYRADDYQPIGDPGDVEEPLEVWGSGWGWSEKDGNLRPYGDWYYTERIGDNWFFFESFRRLEAGDNPA